MPVAACSASADLLARNQRAEAGAGPYTAEPRSGSRMACADARPPVRGRATHQVTSAVQVGRNGARAGHLARRTPAFRGNPAPATISVGSASRKRRQSASHAIGLHAGRWPGQHSGPADDDELGARTLMAPHRRRQAIWVAPRQVRSAAPPFLPGTSSKRARRRTMPPAAARPHQKAEIRQRWPSDGPARRPVRPIPEEEQRARSDHVVAFSARHRQRPSGRAPGRRSSNTPGQDWQTRSRQAHLPAAQERP